MSTNISIFSRASQTKDGKVIPFDVFLDNIREGKWQDYVLPIRAMKTKEERTEAKKKVPYVTLSGVFAERNSKGATQYSGRIGVDIDDVDPEVVKEKLKADRYVNFIFTSISGQGACVGFKINPEKHTEAFDGIAEYLLSTYGLVVDPKARNISQARFVSYDPHLFLNPHADKFAIYPKKQKALTKIPEVVYVQSDFEEIIQAICSRRIDITGGYQQWLGIAYGLADKFSEGGRQYFHDISQFSPLYKYDTADRQFSACLRDSASSKRATIATVYFLAKQAGIQTVSAQTKIITQAAYLAKKGRRTQGDTVKLLEEAEGIAPEDSQDIVDQVFKNNITPPDEDSPIDALEMWMRQNFDLRRNAITRKIENYGVDVEEEDLNSYYIEAKRIFDKEVTSEIFNKLIFSRFTPTFNPFQEFFDKHSSRNPKGAIEALFESIESDTGLSGSDFFPEYKTYFGRKWMVGLISAMHGEHSPLMLVLSGNKQGTGKTEFWHRLLPQELQKYYTESKLDRGKDDEILMTQKALILIDEMSALDDKEIAAFKRLTSKKTFSLRAPYGKQNIDLQRLAVLCGTTQENEILVDPTGNRRIIPINVLSIDHAAYNKVDKIDLIMEAYHLYKAGFNWQLTADDIRILNNNTSFFEKPSAEYDLLMKYFEAPEKENDPYTEFVSTTEIKSYLEMRTGQRLGDKKLGMELKRIGLERKQVKEKGKHKWGYFIVFTEKKTVTTSPLSNQNPF